MWWSVKLPLVATHTLYFMLYSSFLRDSKISSISDMQSNCITLFITPFAFLTKGEENKNANCKLVSVISRGFSLLVFEIRAKLLSFSASCSWVACNCPTSSLCSLISFINASLRALSFIFDIREVGSKSKSKLFTLWDLVLLKPTSLMWVILKPLFSLENFCGAFCFTISPASNSWTSFLTSPTNCLSSIQTANSYHF